MARVMIVLGEDKVEVDLHEGGEPVEHPQRIRLGLQVLLGLIHQPLPCLVVHGDSIGPVLCQHRPVHGPKGFQILIKGDLHTDLPV
jgi:hypothetical protein